MKKKIVLIITFVILLIAIVASSTYAIYTWAMNDVVKSKADCFNINYIKGQDIGSENKHRLLMASADYTGGLYASVNVSMDNNCIKKGIGTLYLNTDEITSSALLSSGALKYQVIVNSINLGNSGTISSTGSLAIAENFEVTTSVKQFTVVVWLDGNLVNDDNGAEILSSTYKGNISMRIESGDYSE